MDVKSRIKKVVGTSVMKKDKENVEKHKVLTVKVKVDKAFLNYNQQNKRNSAEFISSQPSVPS